MKDLDYRKIVSEAMDYADYRALVTELNGQGKTTGPDQSEVKLYATGLNIKRMDKWDKIAKFSPEVVERVNNLRCLYTWLVLTEGWCGDAAQIVPFAAKLASETPLINLKLILRDENPEVMDQFLTEGTKSIPKIVVLDDAFNVTADWGPRPKPAQEILRKHKTGPEWDKDAFHEDLHLWYAKDRGLHTMNELIDLVDQCG